MISTDSRLLFQALRGVYTDLGFESVADEVFADLVIARIVEPTSRLAVGRVLEDLGRQPASYSTMRRALARVYPKHEEGAEGQDDGVNTDTESYRDLIAAKCFAHASASEVVAQVRQQRRESMSRRGATPPRNRGCARRARSNLVYGAGLTLDR